MRFRNFRRSWRSTLSVWLVYWRLGDTYMRLKQYDEAEKALKQALWLNESFTGSYLMLGKSSCKRMTRSWRVDSWNAQSSWIRKITTRTTPSAVPIRSWGVRTMPIVSSPCSVLFVRRSTRAEEDTMEQMTH